MEHLYLPDSTSNPSSSSNRKRSHIDSNITSNDETQFIGDSTPAAPSRSKRRCISINAWPEKLSTQVRVPVDAEHTLGRVVSCFPPNNRECSCQQVTVPIQDVLSNTRNQIITTVVGRLRKLFRDRKQYKRLLLHRGTSAQGLLDIFQQLLDSPDMVPSNFRSDLIVAIQRLSTKSGLYPTGFELNNVTALEDCFECYGASADIQKGVFQDQPVCLKIIRLHRNSKMQQFLKACSKEAILWGQLSHPNLLPFYGIYRFRNRFSLVSPWMEYGDVNNYLQNHPHANRILLAFDVAQGLCFLHDNGIVHGDLKGPNILINEQERACVADFGLSSISDPNIPTWTSHSSVASKGGSVRWQAPELFDPENDEEIHNTTSSDIYAWACVGYEIFVGRVPFSHLSRDTIISLKVRNGERPARPLDSSPSWTNWGLTENIWTLIQDGWATEPADRPTAKQLIQRLGFVPPLDCADAQHGGMLSPAQSREMARTGRRVEEISVETLESLLTSH